MQYSQPLVHCKNTHCPVPIRLPYPSPQETTSRQEAWPKADWRTLIACHECGHVYNYTVGDIHWRPFETPAPSPLRSPRAVFCLRFQCISNNCDVPVRIHTEAASDTDKATLWKRATGWTLHATCARGHRLKVPAFQVCHIWALHEPIE